MSGGKFGHCPDGWVDAPSAPVTGENMKNNEILSIVRGALPYANQIKNIDVTSEEDAIRFDWRFNRFRVSAPLGVETVKNGVLHGCDLSIVVEHILKQAEIVAVDRIVAQRRVNGE